ncbi:MAG TPA: hypothetical protein VJ927_04090 [Actinomycetota bacterium]|nr:hypothetical protein [Actinomycetota bacterium]
MKRALLIAVMLVLAAPVVASAAPGDAVSIEFSGVSRGSVVEGTVSFKALASSPAGIKRVDLVVGDTTVDSVEPSGIKQRVELPYEWATNYYVGSTELSANGNYEIKVHAVANGGADKTSAITVTVDNAPEAPDALQAAPTREGVSLAWAPNDEPDIIGYQIERGDGTTFELVGETAETYFDDLGVAPGDHSYRVTAVRNSTARSTGRPSYPSEPVVVTIAAPSASGSAGTKGGAHKLGSVGGRKSAPRGFKVRESSFAPRGLPSGIALPGTIGLPSLPADEAPAWGTYEEQLPYELPKGGVQLSAKMPTDDNSFVSWSVIPPDGLRWVAGGLLLLALAILLRLVAVRLDMITEAPTPQPAAADEIEPAAA